MHSMIHDLLDHDPLYLDIQNKGLHQGLEQGLQQAVITLVVARFADLETLASTEVSAIRDVARLQQLIADLSRSKTREQMERVLLSLGE